MCLVAIFAWWGVKYTDGREFTLAIFAAGGAAKFSNNSFMSPNARSATKKSGLPKRDLRDIEAAAAAGRRKATKSTSKQVAGVGSGSGEVNSYLAGLADPKYAGKGSKIPDSETIPSVAFQTSYVDTIATDSRGRLLAFHAPTLSNGGFHPALTNTAASASVRIFAIDPSSPSEVPANYTNFEIHDIVPAATLAAIRSNFAAVRPVSMSVQVTPTQALLNASGFFYAGTLSREQSPAALSSSIGGAPGPGEIVRMATVPVLDQLISGAQYQANITKPLTILWRFEDGQDFVYRETARDSNISVGTGNGGAYIAYQNYSSQSSFVQPVIWPGGAGQENLWFVPGGYGNEEDALPIPGNVGSRPDQMYCYPSVFLGAEGCAASTTIAEVTFVINWEGLPIVGTSSIMSATPSPTSPMELAQAQNIVPSMPVAFDPTSASQPEAQIVQAVKKAASEDVSKPSAVKGRSVVSKIAGFAARGLATILPFPLSLVATGAEAFAEAM